jgi:Flp pilus assembly protein TadB
MVETLFLLLIFLSIYLFYLVYRFPVVQLEKRILSYVNLSPINKTNSATILKTFFRLNFKKSIIKSEVPDRDIAELSDLLALALVAGSSPIQGLTEIVDLIAEPLRSLLKDVLFKAASGISFDKAMGELTQDYQSDSINTLVKSLKIAGERGTPLAEILRSFSHDLRSKNREKIIRSAAKKEITMLVPIVFVVLPTVLVIALYPALQVIKNLS